MSADKPLIDHPPQMRFARHRGRRPHLEPLEARTVLASYFAANVPDLIAAMDASNLTPEADTIELAPNTVFTLTNQNNASYGVNGLPLITSGGDLTILGRNSTIERSAALGTPRLRLFKIEAGGSLTLKDLTLQGGMSIERGGAIYNDGTLVVDSVVIQGNTTVGDHFLPPPGEPSHGTDAAGGGIYSTGSLSILNSTIRDNRAIGGNGGNGYLYRVSLGGSKTVKVAGGDGGDGLGGGVHVAAGTAAIRNSTITGNHAEGGRGGLAIQGGKSGRNGKGIGGGIYIAAGAVVGLDAFTKQNVKNNTSSSKNADIYGSYSLLA